MIQIRNVPEEMHRKLKSRAALAGKSLSDFLLEELRWLAARPSREELAERLARRSRVVTSVSPARVVRTERDGQ